MFFNFNVASSGSEASPKKIVEYIMHHLQDSDKWHPLPAHLVEITFPKEIFGIPFQNGLHFSMLLICSLVLILLFGLFYKKSKDEAPRGLTNALEALVEFVRNDISIAYLGEKDGKRFAPFFLNFFFFIFTLNVLGLIPFFSTATANINVTGALALIVFTMMILGGLIKNGPIGFIKIFMPSGVPFVLNLFILFPIEFLGSVIKPVVLMVRLFANMLAGHMVIYFILALVPILGIVFGGGVAAAVSIPATALSLFIYLIEVLVAFIQAYIFTLLSAMFFASMLHPDH